MTDTHTSLAKGSAAAPADDAAVPGPDTSLATEAPPGRESAPPAPGPSTSCSA